MRIGVDLMGSDTCPQILFEAVLQAVSLLGSSDTLVIYASSSLIQKLSKNFVPQIKWKTTKDEILMSDDPLFAVRHKKKSSIVLGIKDLKKQELDAFISAGNTGALMASATLYLSKLEGVRRLALLALLPTKNKPVALIDVGGNVSCKAHHLIQFAKIGAAYQSCLLNIEVPRVGLLNIGIESKKGTFEVRQAYESLLKDDSSKMQFVGNIEGAQVFEGNVDVLVTSGVTGNILLKTAEGMASFILETVAAELEPVKSDTKTPLEKLNQQFSYAEYPGAILSGIDGIVIKCHGYSSARAMYSSIKEAITLCRQDFLSKIKDRL